MDEDLQRHLSFMINCMGIIFSLAWVLVNKGSKYWQENWEKHIDMLEDDVTGPIYKYVLEGRSYSVSSINLLVSYFVALIWFLLGCGKLCTEFKADYSPDPIIIITIVITIIWALIMLICGRTKSNDERKPILFEKRENDTKTPSQLPKPKLNFCKKTKFSLNKFCKVLLK